jgi:hypothetical protein
VPVSLNLGVFQGTTNPSHKDDTSASVACSCSDALANQLNAWSKALFDKPALLPPHSYGKPETAAAVDRLLMMGKRMPETC